MNIRKRWLSLALALQVILTASLFVNYEADWMKSAPQPFASASLASVNRLIIEDGEQSLALTKRDQQWWLMGEPELPVALRQVENLLTEVERLQPSLPVVTSPANHARLEVAEDDFYRKLTLLQDEQEVASMFVGSSPAIRQAHIRKAGQDAVYALRFDRYELSTDGKAWLDKTLLQAEAISRVTSDQWLAEKSAEEWQISLLDDTLDSDNLDKNKIINWVSGLENLRVLEPSTLEQAPTAEHLVLAVTVEQSKESQGSEEGGEGNKVEGNKGGGVNSGASTQWRYEFFDLPEGKYVRRDDIDTFFKITSRDFETLAQIDFSATQVADSEAVEVGNDG